jgi:ABC-type transport system involved in Fe-S cluster assembly fused permease/ATPase subunit
MNGRAKLREVVAILFAEMTGFVKWRMVSQILLVMGASVLTGLGPVGLKYLVDGLTEHGDHRPVFPLVLVTLYVLALSLARVANGVRGLIFGRMEERIYRTLSERLFSHMMCLPLRFHLDRQTGAVSHALGSALEGLRIILRQVVFTLLPVAAELTTVLLVLAGLVTAPFLAMFSGAVVCYLAAFWYSAATVTNVARSASSARIEAAAAMTDGLLNYETVKYFTAESLVQDRVARALRRSEFEWGGVHRCYAVNGLGVAGIFAAILAGTVFYGTEEVRRGHMTIGSFVLVNTYMIQVVRPVEMVGYAIQGVSQGVAMLDKLVRLFREPTEHGGFGGRGVASGPGFLEFQDVSLSYGVGRKALTGLSVSVAAGRTLGIVGPSGSGKSTIIRLLTRLMEPDGGRILLDGVPIRSMPLQDLRRAIAVVPQDTVLFADTLRYNIAFGRTDAGADEIEYAARTGTTRWSASEE